MLEDEAPGHASRDVDRCCRRRHCCCHQRAGGERADPIKTTRCASLPRSIACLLKRTFQCKTFSIFAVLLVLSSSRGRGLRRPLHSPTLTQSFLFLSLPLCPHPPATFFEAACSKSRAGPDKARLIRGGRERDERARNREGKGDNRSVGKLLPR